VNKTNVNEWNDVSLVEARTLVFLKARSLRSLTLYKYRSFATSQILSNFFLTFSVTFSLAARSRRRLRREVFTRIITIAVARMCRSQRWTRMALITFWAWRRRQFAWDSSMSCAERSEGHF